jgi:predicted nucleic acid-binding protein
VSLFVVDASVVIKWFIPEVHSDAARRWLDSSHEHIAPDLLFPEAGSTIWKKVRRGELTREDGQRLAADLPGIAVETVSTRALLPDALALAVHAGITVYDAIYVTLAVRLRSQVITADERLNRALGRHVMLGQYVRPVEAFTE